MKKSSGKSLVYIPPNADMNFENKAKDPPKTEYDHRQFVLNRRNVLKVTGLSNAIQKESEDPQKK